MAAARAALLLALACGAMAGVGTAGTPAALLDAQAAEANASRSRVQQASPPPAPGRAGSEAQVQAHVDFAVGCVLLGAVTFIMTLFYFLNSKDPDRRNYSWAIVSSAIVTFCGVLVTSAWNGLNKYFYSEYTGSAPGQNAQALLCLWAYLGWYLALQVVLAYLSGAIGQAPKSVDSMVSECKCWATLMSMITGNSCMSFWGLVQISARTAYPESTLAIFLVIPICVICQLVLFWVSHRARYWTALADDGKMDQYEALWDKFVADLEGSVLNMSVSHLSIQAVRAVISGDMPLFNGTNPPGFHAQLMDAYELFLMALVFGITMVVVNLIHIRFRGIELKVTKSRLKGTLGNCIAFCVLWGLNWSIGRTWGVHGVVGGMVLALVVTMLGMFLIVVLDQLADLECTGETFDEELYAFCPCIAILIGFSWKQAFTTSVGTLTQQTHYLDPAIETLILTACLVTVVIPAWKWYILPVILEPELAAIKKTMPDVENLEGENAVRLAIAGTAQYDVKAMQEAEEQRDPSRAAGLHAALLQKRDTSAPGDELLRRRNEELEMAIARIHGLCSAAGGARV